MMDNCLLNELKAEERKILLLGIGNSGRGDDGLGWSFVDAISEGPYDVVDCEFRYQLQVEDADLIAGYDTVIFVDASQENLKEGFEIRPCTATNNCSFTTHALAPGGVVYLTNTLYHKFPEVYVLAIAGVSWELQVGLSKEAGDHLNAALGFFKESILPALQQERTSIANLEAMEGF